MQEYAMHRLHICDVCSAPVYVCLHLRTRQPAAIDAESVVAGRLILLPNGAYDVATAEERIAGVGTLYQWHECGSASE